MGAILRDLERGVLIQPFDSLIDGFLELQRFTQLLGAFPEPAAKLRRLGKLGLEDAEILLPFLVAGVEWTQIPGIFDFDLRPQRGALSAIAFRQKPC